MRNLSMKGNFRPSLQLIRFGPSGTVGPPKDTQPRGRFVHEKGGQMQFAQKTVKKPCGRENHLAVKTMWPWKHIWPWKPCMWKPFGRETSFGSENSNAAVKTHSASTSSKDVEEKKASKQTAGTTRNCQEKKILDQTRQSTAVITRQPGFVPRNAFLDSKLPSSGLTRLYTYLYI